MNQTAERVASLINLYFNQLIRGCRNPNCSNRNCASSPSFEHPGIDANQAAVKAIDLLRARAPLCMYQSYFPAPITISTTSSTENDRQEEVPSRQNPQPVSQSADQQSVEEDAGVGGASYSEDTTEDEEGINTLMNVMASFASQDPLRGSFSSLSSNSASESGGGGLNRLLNLSSPRDPFSLVTELLRFSENDHAIGQPSLRGPIGSHSGPLNLNRRQRSPTSNRGPTYADAFNDLQSLDVKEAHVASGENVHSTDDAMAPASVSGTTDALSESDDLRTLGLSLLELESWVADGRKSNDWSQLSHILSVIFSSFDALSNSFTDSPVVISETANQSPEDASSLPASNVGPVNLAVLKKAWALVEAVKSEQVVDALVLAVRHLARNKLAYPMSAESGQSSSPSVDSPDRHQRLVNVFLILYECPYVSDPRYFDRFLPYIIRCTTWLPIALQADLCRALAASSKLDSAASALLSTDTDPPNTLWALHKIIQQHISFRVLLLTGDTEPNDDVQVCEAALVSRLVYYASLLAGQMDSEETQKRESEVNAEFVATLPLRHRPSGSRSRRLQPIPPLTDTLGDQLKLSPNDCRKPIIPATEFVNEILNAQIQPKNDVNLLQLGDPGTFVSFASLPFLLETSQKIEILQLINQQRMYTELRDVYLNWFGSSMSRYPVFKLNVSREHIVEEALLGLEIALTDNPSDLRKQLQVEFTDEEGLDEGGLSKEFFQLIIERIFDPIYGMFILDTESQLYWFNPTSLSDVEREYCLIGMLLGLAIYNSIILDVHFPAVLYRKLAGKLGTFADLADFNPTLARGLQELLDYKDDDLEENFDCSFLISYTDPYGGSCTHELKPDGANIPVTRENRQEYVHLYADFLLNDSVKKQFTAFRRGFQCVVDDSPLFFLFLPAEIELLVCGSRVLDFDELERVTQYEGYTSESPAIKMFWSVVHDMTHEEKCRLLQFSTGSDRVPVGGLAKMHFKIFRQGSDNDRLPSAHTCFNILLLPGYSTRERLETKLKIAISHCKGFGLR